MGLLQAGASGESALQEPEGVVLLPFNIDILVTGPNPFLVDVGPTYFVCIHFFGRAAILGKQDAASRVRDGQLLG